MKPALSPEQLDARILRDFAEVPNRAVGNILHGLLPSSMVPVMLRQMISLSISARSFSCPPPSMLRDSR